MKQTWRWFGPNDLVSIDDMLQAGVEGVVSALHHVPAGDVWLADDIKQRQHEIATMRDGNPSGLAWDVVESLPVSEAIKKQKGEWRQHIRNYNTSLANLSAAGIKTICYNFMPLLDWTRTDLAWRLPHGGNCMRFDIVDFVVFDLYILKRIGAHNEFSTDLQVKAKQRFSRMDATRQKQLVDNIICGLPGSAEQMNLEDVKNHLHEYDGISTQHLRNHYIAFLEEVSPLAEKLGMRLCCHPDDPPFSLLGLPRIMSTEKDYQTMMQAVDLSANGITLCSGSLGARADNNLPQMMRTLGSRVHFLHLRNVKREGSDIPCSFYEAEHLAGDTDMVALIAAVLDEQYHRKMNGRDDFLIPMRPDHGQCILDDIDRQGQPGYPAIGRLRGLAELRGVMQALAHPEVESRLS